MRPLYRVLAGSLDITAAVLKQLISIEVVDEVGHKSDKCILRLSDPDGRLQIPPPGLALAVSLGFKERGLWPLGLFTVEEVSLEGWQPQTMTVSCIAADMTKGLKLPKSRSWHEQTLEDIVGTIAGEHGLEPCVSPPLAFKKVEHVDQSEESDLNFLERLASERNAIVKPQMGKLAFKVRGDGKTCSGAPIPPALIFKTQMMKPSFKYRERPKAKETKAKWTDRGAAKEDPQTGSAGGEGGTSIMRGTWPTKLEAQEAADACAKEQKRLEMSGRFTTEGRPDLFAEGPVLIAGCRLGIDGLWIAKSVRHRFDAKGYFATTEVVPPTDMEEGTKEGAET